MKNSINGPMKNAVIIVPIPTIVGTCMIFPPEIKNVAIPMRMHTMSVIIRTYRNLPFFQVFTIINATASYVETPKSAVIYKDAAMQFMITAIIRDAIRIAICGEGIRKTRSFSEYSAIYPSRNRLINVAIPI